MGRSVRAMLEECLVTIVAIEPIKVSSYTNRIALKVSRVHVPSCAILYSGHVARDAKVENIIYMHIFHTRRCYLEGGESWESISSLR